MNTTRDTETTGDRQALNDAWAELRTRLRRFVGRRVNDPHAADDVTQDVLLKVQGRMDAMPEGENLPAWVFAVARNAVVDHYRARAARDHAALDGAGPAFDDPAAERQEAIRELAPCLEKMVRQLPEPYREAMRLADFEGLSQQELAGRTGVSLSGAKSRVQRARLQLKEMIEDCCRVERDARGGVADVHPTDRTGRYCGDAGPADGGCGGG